MLPEFPYKECITCKDLGDCKHVVISEDLMGRPLPPEECPNPMDKIKAKKKNDRKVD